MPLHISSSKPRVVFFFFFSSLHICLWKLSDNLSKLHVQDSSVEILTAFLIKIDSHSLPDCPNTSALIAVIYWCVAIISLHLNNKWPRGLYSSIFSDKPNVTRINQVIHTGPCLGKLCLIRLPPLIVLNVSLSHSVVDTFFLCVSSSSPIPAGDAFQNCCCVKILWCLETVVEETAIFQYYYLLLPPALILHHTYTFWTNIFNFVVIKQFSWRFRISISVKHAKSEWWGVYLGIRRLWVQSLPVSNQRRSKWCPLPPCLALSNRSWN